MDEDDLVLVITVVVEAANEQQARAACDALISRAGAQIVDARDCSDEEPGCWAVVITRPSTEKATHNVAAALARAVRTFVRGLGEGFSAPRVACEPPTAWTVLDEPELINQLVPGAERVMVEVWAGDDPFGAGTPRDKSPSRPS
ncbi:hypothetical protein SK854_15145 [Lentzea sp. BCCO 10_0061]|jgi:hypothetical protein|uniref:Uncharacterized protein n=1 Tax=Lentzea sokolovensis TaxID=3095429 RepID=A0ABU4UVE0_9PSEU|nr:hypothetical protein [Lentzea sp. BCCO 10_0061]MDX8143459.1 hypothetical protein [Lentzea sp. BCCO 10_0061]